MKKLSNYISVSVFVLALGAIAAVVLPKSGKAGASASVPDSRAGGGAPEAGFEARAAAAEDGGRVSLLLEDGELSVTSLTGDFDGDGAEEQFVAYRNFAEENNPIYLTYIDYDAETQEYRRVWSGATAAAQPGAVSLFAQDFIGDRSLCAALAGMNAAGEHTLSVFRAYPDGGEPVRRIADITIDGAISVVERERTQAYRLGLADGASFDIRGRGRDPSSSNEFSQIEVTYSYNARNGRYERSDIRPVEGARIEAALRNGILSGRSADFERFIQGLWYRVPSDSQADSQSDSAGGSQTGSSGGQYIYFDTERRELIFYDNDTQQVYNWLSSASTRYGLYVASQNISVATLRRLMDIELESMDSVRVRVFEDVRMNIGISAAWDGSYRKASALKKREERVAAAGIDAVYSGPSGGIAFYADGSCRIGIPGLFSDGRYAFFVMDGREYLELREESGTDAVRTGATGTDAVRAGAVGTHRREVYRVLGADGSEGSSAGMAVSAESPDEPQAPPAFALKRVLPDTRGILDLNEAAIILRMSN